MSDPLIERAREAKDTDPALYEALCEKIAKKKGKNSESYSNLKITFELFETFNEEERDTILNTISCFYGRDGYG
jgi:hypothetical protein